MDLDEIRQQINRVDDRMRELFLERMACAAAVAEEKRRTKGRVFVPEREQEILRMRRQGVQPELEAECTAFFKQVMGISRTYQYAKLAEESELLCGLPDGQGEVSLTFFCGTESGYPAAALNAASLAGLLVSECSAVQSLPGEMSCKLRLAGDFSQKTAQAAVLQILEETQGAVLRFGSESL